MTWVVVTTERETVLVNLDAAAAITVDVSPPVGPGLTHMVIAKMRDGGPDRVLYRGSQVECGERLTGLKKELAAAIIL